LRIAIDDGHGNNTAGKRTPTLPDGSIIKENEFNQAVARLLVKELDRCGFETLLVAPEAEDVALATRVKRANDAKADIYISIHYNASNGQFDSKKGGVETYCHPHSTKGRKLAEAVHKHLIKGTPQADRGTRTANFFVLRETSMPAILVEAGFMDMLGEAKLMKNPDFQGEVAREIAQGVCEYLEVEFKQTNCNNGIDTIIQNAINAGLITDRIYWTEVLLGRIQPKPEYISTIFQRAHSKITEK